MSSFLNMTRAMSSIGVNYQRFVDFSARSFCRDMLFFSFFSASCCPFSILMKPGFYLVTLFFHATARSDRFLEFPIYICIIRLYILAGYFDWHHCFDTFLAFSNHIPQGEEMVGVF